MKEFEREKREIVELGQELRRCKDRLLAGGTDPYTVNRREDIGLRVARLKKLKRDIMWHMAQEIAVDDEDDNHKDRALHDFLFAVSFQQTWCSQGRHGLYTPKYAKLLRSILCLVAENNRWEE